MTEKCLKIMYDATILVDGEYDNACRSGIYFVALNVLKELEKNDSLDISLFASPSKSAGLDYVIKSKFPRQKAVYKNTIISKKFFSILSAVQKKRKKYFHQPMIRKIFSLMELLFVSCFDCFFCVKNLLNCRFTFDAYFSPLTAAPWYIRCLKKIKKYVVLYDIIPLKIDEYSSQKESNWFGHLIRRINSNDHFFAISQATKNDFCKFCPCINSGKVDVVYLAANEHFYSIKSDEKLKVIKSKYNLPQERRYVFSLCTLEPRKNLVRAVRTFVDFVKKNEINDLVFVLGGGSWKTFSEKIKEGLSNPELFDKYVLKAGYVEDEDLPVLYSNAEWFVYTSQYEGFGLPPLEAMQCGCPVITSNNSSLPEVVGDAGILIDWDSDEQHIAAYEKYYFDKKFRDMKASEGLEQAKLFSWKKTVDQMVAVMNASLRA